MASQTAVGLHLNRMLEIVERRRTKICGIAGFIAHDVADANAQIRPKLTSMLRAIAQRGPDCFGYAIWGINPRTRGGIQGDTWNVELLMDEKVSGNIDQAIEKVVLPAFGWERILCLVNFRGIPTSEDYGLSQEAIQPFIGEDVYVVHNGLLHNDKQMYEKYGWQNLTSLPNDIDSYAFNHIFSHSNRDLVHSLLNEVEGSFAVAAFNHRTMHLTLARNFRGLSLVSSRVNGVNTLWFASESQALTGVSEDVPYELPLNSAVDINLRAPYQSQLSPRALSAMRWDLKPQVENDSAIVVLSGGLDSTVCATLAAQTYKRVHLMHFQYGCRAEEAERKAFLDIAAFLAFKYPMCTITHSIEDLGFIKRLGGSTLTDMSKEVANGEQGVETDHEWVPARNTVMISLAAAYCDRHNIGHIILGLNMEEGSVYADNSIEFYQRMEAALAIGAKSAPKLEMPLGNMMKRHILRRGIDIGAPLHLSWSCYHGGEMRCGTCGPCIMRRKAFEANGEPEVVEYANAAE